MSHPITALRELLKEIEEIPEDNILDKYLIINEIKNIIKDSQKNNFKS